MAQYDPKVIQEFADKLYKQAATIVATYLIAGLVIGGAVGIGVEILVKQQGLNAPCLVTVGLAVLGGVFGFFIGQEKAFDLKLRAQTALCQAKIEENTRKVGG